VSNADRRAAKKQRRADSRTARAPHDRTVVQIRCEACNRLQTNATTLCVCGHATAVYA
jgi:hypothetical protein